MGSTPWPNLSRTAISCAAPIVRKLNEAVRTVLASADLAQAAALQGASPAYMAPEQLGPEMQRESVEWGKVIKAQKISAD